jgi:peptidoglycan/xylan/chitin deacetylase (PgdA/CDA1 family)
MNTGLDIAVRRIETAADAVYLTFDDGPDEDWTPRILDLLAAARASATFFAIGRQAERSGALLRRVQRAGHGIGNHGYEHRHPWTGSATQARAEVRHGADAIAGAIGTMPRAYRPAFGRHRRAMFDEARQCGQRVVLWSLSAMDWGVFARQDGIARRLERMQAGDIVLLHDGRNRHNHPETVVNVLPSLLSSLSRRGLVAASLADTRSNPGS